MTIPRSQAELVTLRKLAQDLAAARKERPTSVHLLAAIASREGQAGELLRERRLEADALLKAGRSFDEDSPDPLARAVVAARELGKRAPLGEPNALHLILALLADRSSAAHRALVQAGVDTARLRTAAMQRSLGVVAARRLPQTAGGKTTEADRRPALQKPTRIDLDKPTPTKRPTGTGVTVPLFPPPGRLGQEQRPPAKSAPIPPTSATATPIPLSAPAPAKPAENPPKQAARQDAAIVPVIPEGHPLALDRAKTPTLAALGKNLTLAACLGEMEPVIGRDLEVDAALDILAKKNQNSCLLVGPAGVGKTSVARGIAERLAREADADPSSARLFVELAVSELVAGTGTRGALAERMNAILREIREEGRVVILFVDEIHELFSGGLDEATAEIKLALARGDLRMVGATTPEEQRRSFEPDPALARRFSVVEIEEPDEESAFLLCKQVCAGLGAHHGLSYADESIASAVSWSVRYLPGRALPDKAIGILDLAGARVKRRAGPGKLPPVGPPEVAEVLASLADIPEERLLETDRERMLNLEKLLADRVVGHSAPLGRIARVLRRNAAGIRADRPLGTFLLLGPTGVGKTETAKAIAEALFHSVDAMTRLDLSEYSEAHATARLIGAPPGYVGHEAGGQLTEAVRRRAYQVILLDEIEKAHRDVLEAFLQVFDEGRMTDGRGRRVDFTNTVIVLTSNLGAAEAGALKSERSVGFSRGATQVSPDKLESTMLAAARGALPPELYNRIDEVLVFGPLGKVEVKEVARRLLAALGRGLEEKGIRLDVEPAVLDVLLAEGGFDEGLGARPMKRAIMRHVEAPIAEMILRGELPSGSVALLSVDRGQIVVDAVDEAGGELATGA
ncbi:AAA family ATPase [Polyangium spumosum]|uniref:AAA domain-containing protein n=1 Tax=Polyangium spumosum TaxID=889282 RepID=A0A6N7PXK6_9BACT|nr:ATP-dependent Clp protease ATP-binding subunit [Polyangium spumosum]MRG96972.1 AAA domain-containing protein [Polyangium spumosum]